MKRNHYAPLFRTFAGRAPKKLQVIPEEEEEKPRTKKERWEDLTQFIEETRSRYDPEEQNQTAYEQKTSSASSVSSTSEPSKPPAPKRSRKK